MKKLLILYATVISFLSSIAQNVAINNDGSLPTIGAMLDVKSSNKGILNPRIALTGTDDILTVPNRPEGLLVYNTASSAGGTVAPGFYYWDGASWVRLTNNTNALLGWWLLGGNNGMFKDDGVISILLHTYYSCIDPALQFGSGAYSVSNHTVIFNYTDGRKIKIALIGLGFDSKDQSPATLSLGFNSDVLTKR